MCLKWCGAGKLRSGKTFKFNKLFTGGCDATLNVFDADKQFAEATPTGEDQILETEDPTTDKSKEKKNKKTKAFHKATIMDLLPMPSIGCIATASLDQEKPGGDKDSQAHNLILWDMNTLKVKSS